jgi:hypothetical protein
MDKQHKVRWLALLFTTIALALAFTLPNVKIDGGERK